MKAAEVLNRFTTTSIANVRYTGTTHESYGDIDEYNSNHSFYRVNNVNNRVQSAYWFEEGSKKQKETIDLNNGYVVAETFSREKYPEFWKISDIRDTKVMTKNLLASGKNSELQYEWWEIYYAPKKNTTHFSEIPGLNSVSVTVSPFTGQVIGYSEIYTPSVVSGIPPVNLTPTLSEEEAMKIAEEQFRIMGAHTLQTTPELLRLRLSTDSSNTPHLTWIFGMTRSQKIGSKDDEFESIEHGLVSIDAHDGTIIRSTPFS